LIATLIIRINIYLRWMVRKDNRCEDFGIWNSISPSILSCPLDIHSGNVARKLGLLTLKLNDAKPVSELDFRIANSGTGVGTVTFYHLSELKITTSKNHIPHFLRKLAVIPWTLSSTP
jgi:hypothetical protein